MAETAFRPPRFQCSPADREKDPICGDGVVRDGGIAVHGGVEEEFIGGKVIRASDDELIGGKVTQPASI
jgi:hypothetical protein